MLKWHSLLIGMSGLADCPLEQYQTNGTQSIMAFGFVHAIPVAHLPDEA